MQQRQRFYDFAVIHEMKQQSPRGEMSSPDGELKGRPEDNAWRDKENEYSPFHKVLFIANYSGVLHTVPAWKWERHRFTSLQQRINTAEVKCEGCSITIAIYHSLTYSRRSLQTHFLHNLFCFSFCLWQDHQCVRLRSNILMFQPWIHNRECYCSFVWAWVISLFDWMTTCFFLPEWAITHWVWLLYVRHCVSNVWIYNSIMHHTHFKSLMHKVSCTLSHLITCSRVLWQPTFTFVF